MDVRNGRWRVLLATFSAAIASLVFVANGFAAALVQDVKGVVRTQTAAVEKGQTIPTGATLTTGPSSQVILVFDDGQKVVLNENTQFAITNYQFAKDNPQSDRSFFSLLRGAARVVTGALVQRSRSAFEFRTTTSTIGIRGTDFMVAVVDQPSYLSVLQGEVAATNTAGTATFGAGTFGAMTAANVLAIAIPATALPAVAAAAFSSLGAAAVGAAAGAAAGAAGGAAGAVGIGTVAVVGGVAAAAAVASSSKSSTSNSSSSSSSTSSTGTSAFAGSAHGNVTLSGSGTAYGSPTTFSCPGTWTGTIDATGTFSGSETVSTCTGSGFSGVVPVGIVVPTSFVLDATGAVPAFSFSSVASNGLNQSCSSSPSGVFTTNGATFNLSCTVSGTDNTCTSGICTVNANVTWQYTRVVP